jgi:hypothetical protein
MPYDYDALKRLSIELRRPVGTLYALSPQNDPFYIGPSRQAWAEWFADIWRSFDIPVGYHYRRIHYRLVSSASPVALLGGGVYLNTEQCWDNLNMAARDAVALGLVPLDAFVDRRNPDPFIYVAYPVECRIDDIRFAVPFITTASFFLPERPRFGALIAGSVPQPYHIEVWAEKSTMNDILRPLAQAHRCNLITGVGEMSSTRVRELIARFRNSDRPVRILYISDFDPGGQSMPVAVARKLEFEIYRQRLDHNVQLRPILLTHAQCIEYKLPRTPIKDSEKRGTRFEERFGEGATELDALEALHPGVFARIVGNEIKRYWNPDHDKDVRDQIDDLQTELDDIEDEVHAEHEDEIAAFEDEIAELNEELEPLNARAADLHKRIKPVWQAMSEKLRERQPEPDIECPEFDADEDDDPLYDSTRDYVEQIDRYKKFQDKPTARKQRARRARAPRPVARRRRPPLQRGDRPPLRRGN